MVAEERFVSQSEAAEFLPRYHAAHEYHFANEAGRYERRIKLYVRSLIVPFLYSDWLRQEAIRTFQDNHPSHHFIEKYCKIMLLYLLID